jgi:pimeloyl-ACP methyl ester carboxylesterase
VTPALGQRWLSGAERIEVLFCPQSEHAARTPLLFVHGGYVGAWSWAEHFLPWFSARGFPVHAISLRGHGASSERARLHSFSLEDYVQDVALAADSLERPPILVGHSMGALVVQKYLERTAVPAAVLACPVPPFGLLPSAFSLAMFRPSLWVEINALAAGRRASREALGTALFAGPMEAAAMERIYDWMQPESRRALADMTWWGLPQLWRVNRSPALVLGAARDTLIPNAQAAATARMLDAEFRMLDGLGHALMLDARWERAAEALLGWIEERGF